MFDIEAELKKLPDAPGVYLMHGKDGGIIYIGKARVLRRRVRQYFDASRTKSPKIVKMVSLISYFEYIVTDSEVEALILENNLIKEHSPRYNTMLKDDKTYPYIKLTLSEAYPRLVVTRKVGKDKNKYYGPYPQGTRVKEITSLLQQVYKLRTCSLSLPQDAGKNRPCLNYHINRCDAPCTGNVSEEEYAEKIKAVRRFLEGSTGEIEEYITAQMSASSQTMEYERAAEYRDMLKLARKIGQDQKMETDPRDNRDVIGLALEGFDAIIQIFFIRGGKLIDREHFYLTLAPQESRQEALASFLKQYYSGTPYIPAEIYIPDETEETELIERWLSQKAEHRVSIRTPKKGNKERLVALANENAQIILDKDKEKVKREILRTRGAVAEISNMLGIGFAARIESYDISNISGFESVGSMVVFEDGRPRKNEYRKFRIKSVNGPDDYASMAEVLARRFEHEEWKRPDLLLIDGGKGQIRAVRNALGEACTVPVCGMVKDDRHRTRGLIYQDKEYIMNRSGEGFKLICRIQDETHRFAIEYHRSLRSRDQVRSILDDIDGIGPKRRLSLMRTFKSIDAIKAAGVEELAKAEGMNIKAAQSVWDFFHAQ